MIGCAAQTPRFPLRAPLDEDPDQKPVQIACRKEKGDDDKEELVCRPGEYVSSFAWDGADNMVFRPIAKFLEVDPGGEAQNVNALDEVPNSSWFENRLTAGPHTPEQLAVGPCVKDLEPDTAAEGSWLIDQGKNNGATPGFRVRDANGTKFLLKNNTSGSAERASAASAIGVRMYHAAGFNAPCDSVVYFKPSLLKLKPGLKITDNTGVPRPFDQKELDSILDASPHDGEVIRMQSSRWLDGIPLGPFRYEGVRGDDPNDVIPHEERRELRGARLLAAWINHFDAREQNSMLTWQAVDPKDPTSPGYVKHYYLDISDALGSEWAIDGISKRLGKSYYFDGKDIAVDLVSLGMLDRPWYHSKRDPRMPGYGYFRAEDFVPEQWKAGYQNPAFLRMTERDGAWMARIIARMTPADVEAMTKAGKVSVELTERALIEVLQQRRMAILRRYLSRLSPLADVTPNATGVCARDLALYAQVAAPARFAYRAEVSEAGRKFVSTRVDHAYTDGRVCVDVPRTAVAGGVADADPSRYRVVRIRNGFARGPLEVHLYDLGPARGMTVVGLTRPPQ